MFHFFRVLCLRQRVVPSTIRCLLFLLGPHHHSPGSLSTLRSIHLLNERNRKEKYSFLDIVCCQHYILVELLSLNMNALCKDHPAFRKERLVGYLSSRSRKHDAFCFWTVTYVIVTVIFRYLEPAPSYSVTSTFPLIKSGET